MLNQTATEIGIALAKSYLITCLRCGKALSNPEKNCPNCGAISQIGTGSKKSGGLSKFLSTLALATVAGAVVYGLGTLLLGHLQETVPKAPTPSITAYASAQPLDYRKAMLGEIRAGELVSFTGIISHVVVDRYVMISAKGPDGGIHSTHVYLIFDKKPQTIEGDIVEIFGRYNGTIQYQTRMGGTNVIPEITVDYYKVLKPRG